MQIRFNFLNLPSTKTLQNTYFFLWIPAKSASRNMSPTPPKITRHKWAIWINDMLRVELTIGSILVTTEHERSDTRLEYRGLTVLQNCLQYLLTCFYPKMHLQDLWNRFQFVLCQKLRHFEDNLGPVYKQVGYPSARVTLARCYPGTRTFLLIFNNAFIRQLGLP